MLTRIRTAIRVSLASSITFATVGTAITSLLALPLLSVLFDVLLGSDLDSPDLVRIGYAAGLASLIASICAGIVSAVARDRSMGVFQEIHLRRRMDPIYWMSAAAVPATLSLVTAAIVFGSVFAFSGNDGSALLTALPLVFPAVIVGVCLGVFGAGIGIGLPDPYLGSTLVTSFLPLTAGVIVPVSLYPSWLATFVRFVPGTGTIQALAEESSRAPLLAGGDVLLAFAYAGIGLFITRIAVVRLRNGVRLESI